ncbi:MAG: class I SAM-dependent methyltransferase [Candidatus Hodarchaeota archaeon]
MGNNKVNSNSKEATQTCFPKPFEIRTHRLGIYEFPSYQAFLEIICKRISRTGYLFFDAGCGPGAFLAKLPENIYAVGLDFEKKIREAQKKRKGPQNRFFVVGDLHYLPFKMETFNIICCRDVLEHIRCGKKVLDEFTFVLKKNGVILISTTNLLNPVMLLDTLIPSNISAKIIKKLGGPDYDERNYRFSPWKLIKKLRENELDVALVMFGVPPLLKPSSYYTNNVWLPIRYYPWIVLDKITNFNLFKKFKEMIIAIARK